MHFTQALLALVAAASLGAAAPVAQPEPDVALSQVYGAHQLKTKEDDFKKREAEAEAKPYPQVYGAHVLKMAEDEFKKVKREPEAEAKAYPQVYGAHVLKMAEDEF